MLALASNYFPSPRKIAVIAGVSLTQLIRMRVFLFLVCFVLGLIFLQFFRLNSLLGPENTGESELSLIKNTAFGAMRLFGLVFSVAATALLIPKDTEERIIYTILSKPVPAIDYLAGKALGVIALMAISLVVMDASLCGVLSLRTATVVAEQAQYLTNMGMSLEDMKPLLERTELQGVTWNLQAGFLVMFMEWCVLTSLTLMISCLASTSILSMLLTLSVYFIGLFQNQLVSMLMSGARDGMHWLIPRLTELLGLIFPKFQMYSITDAAVNGQLLPWSIVGNLAWITLAYVLFHLVLSTYFFRRKEF